MTVTNENQPEQFPLTQRLTLLREIMQRADLSATAKNICWLLLIERMNGKTGECFCSNTHIAKQLAIDLRTITRAKLELRKAGVLEPSTQGQNAPTQKNQISFYRFLRRFVGQNAPTQNANMPIGQNAHRGKMPLERTKNKNNNETIAIDIDGPDADKLRRAGIFIPASRTGKFHFKPDSKAAELLRQPQHAETAPPTDDADHFQQWKTAFRAMPGANL